MAPRSRNTRTSESRRFRGSNSYRCRVCSGSHPLRACRRFLRLDAEKRLRAVLINKYCANCLAHRHSGRDCRSTKGCKVCGGNHHTLLHNRASQRSGRASGPAPPAAPASSVERRRRLPESRPVVEDPAPSVATLLQNRSINVLPTALVVLDTGSRTFETVALIDPCTPVSSIDESLAIAFKLPSTRVGTEKVCTATVRAKNGNFQVDAVLKVERRLRVRTPLRPVTEAVRTRFDDIRLADERFHRPSTVSLVLGADVYQKVIQPGFLALGEGLPVAQSTVFGWIVSGACTQP
ncbi:uncharacterized protein LOC121404572 [Drosophila obscura]|uniref:uncharacterized protein LOC121404572 n=1 Tax=Drosophila obscura TaxID=7282 RepID=UPI001BB0E099|nr:uncharacterized protein LOC121404572 [Drosophila obscura]